MSNVIHPPSSPDDVDTVNLKKPRKKDDTPLPAKVESLTRTNLHAAFEEPRLERTPYQKECALATAALIDTLKVFAKEGRTTEEVQALIAEHETRFPELKADLPDIRADNIASGTWIVLVSLQRRTGKYEITMM